MTSLRATFLYLLLVTSLWSKPEHIIFTYMGDPSTTLTVNWQYIEPSSMIVSSGEKASVLFDTVSRGGDVDSYTYSAKANNFQIDGLSDRLILRAQLTGLKPATAYYIVVGDEERGFSKEMKVRTIQVDDSPLRFVTGGDMGTSEDTRILLRNSATFDPDFAVIGGDIAYANGDLLSVNKWDTWLTYYTEEMVSSDGFSIPLVMAIGNHEVDGAYNKTAADAPFFFGFFGQDPAKSYFARRFGRDLLLLVLDSGHVATHQSQADWINATLTEHSSVTYRSAVYHVPLYPSHRDFMGYYSDQGREYWAPVFDDHKLTVAFENHDHTFKRSYLLHNGQISENGMGTLYLGDGCWGRDARTIDFVERSYLAKTGSIQHFWVVDVAPEEMIYRAVDIDNRVFDVYPRDKPGVKAADEVFASINQFYKIPDGLIDILDIRHAVEPWQSGSSSIIIQNPFEHDISLSFSPRISRGNLSLEGLPIEPIQIGPGAQKVIAIELFSKKEDGIKLEDFRAMISVDLDLLDPDFPQPLKFAGRYGIVIEENDAE